MFMVASGSRLRAGLGALTRLADAGLLDFAGFSACGFARFAHPLLAADRFLRAFGARLFGRFFGRLFAGLLRCFALSGHIVCPSGVKTRPASSLGRKID